MEPRSGVEPRRRMRESEREEDESGMRREPGNRRQQRGWRKSMLVHHRRNAPRGEGEREEGREGREREKREEGVSGQGRKRRKTSPPLSASSKDPNSPSQSKFHAKRPLRYSNEAPEASIALRLPLLPLPRSLSKGARGDFRACLSPTPTTQMTGRRLRLEKGNEVPRESTSRVCSRGSRGCRWRST